MRLYEELLDFLPEEIKELGNYVVVGDAIYILLKSGDKIKLTFVYTKTYQHWDAIRMQLINSNNAQIDTITIKFTDLFGYQNIRGLSYDYHIWEYANKLEWYGAKPSPRQIELIQDEIQNLYLVYGS